MTAVVEYLADHPEIYVAFWCVVIPLTLIALWKWMGGSSSE